eukprot:6718721-Prymnesium_polylepis.1
MHTSSAQRRSARRRHGADLTNTIWLRARKRRTVSSFRTSSSPLAGVVVLEEDLPAAAPPQTRKRVNHNPRK